MLYTAACITSQHGNLIQAVWNAESQTLWSSGTDHYWLVVTILAEDRVLKFEDFEPNQSLSLGEEILTKVGNPVEHF
jgi:hypothetical protein